MSWSLIHPQSDRNPLLHRLKERHPFMRKESRRTSRYLLAWAEWGAGLRNIKNPLFFFFKERAIIQCTLLLFNETQIICKHFSAIAHLGARAAFSFPTDAHSTRCRSPFPVLRCHRIVLKSWSLKIQVFFNNATGDTLTNITEVNFLSMYKDWPTMKKEESATIKENKAIWPYKTHNSEMRIILFLLFSLNLLSISFPTPHWQVFF